MNCLHSILPGEEWVNYFRKKSSIVDVRLCSKYASALDNGNETKISGICLTKKTFPTFPKHRLNGKILKDMTTYKEAR